MDDKKLQKKNEYFQKETPLQNIWSNMRGRAVAEENHFTTYFISQKLTGL